MTEKLFKSVTFTLTHAEATVWNSNSFEENLQDLRKRFNNDNLSEYDMNEFEFNDDNTILTVGLDLFEGRDGKCL